MSGISVSRLEDTDTTINSFEITGPMIERILVVCQSKPESLKWVEMLQHHIKLARQPPNSIGVPYSLGHVSSCPPYALLTSWIRSKLEAGVLTPGLVASLTRNDVGGKLESNQQVVVKMRRRHCSWSSSVSSAMPSLSDVVKDPMPAKTMSMVMPGPIKIRTRRMHSLDLDKRASLSITVRSSTSADVDSITTDEMEDIGTWLGGDPDEPLETAVYEIKIEPKQSVMRWIESSADSSSFYEPFCAPILLDYDEFDKLTIVPALNVPKTATLDSMQLCQSPPVSFKTNSFLFIRDSRDEVNPTLELLAQKEEIRPSLLCCSKVHFGSSLIRQDSEARPVYRSTLYTHWCMNPCPDLL